MNHNLEKEQQADYQWYEARGSHFQIGRETAKHAGEVIMLGDGSSEKQKEFALECRRITLSYFPEIRDEFAGYAEALGINEDRLLMHYSLAMEGGCSSIAIRTPDGIFAGRNYDYFYFENRRHLIHTKPLKGFSHIGMHEGLIGGRFDGLNEHGLYINFNGAGSPRPDVKPGVAFHILVRYVLEKCANAAEAKAILMELPIFEPKSYMIADQHDAFVIEAHPDRRACRALEDHFIVAANHYIHPSMEELKRGWTHSINRYDTLADAAKLYLQSPDNSPFAFLKKVLSNHKAPVCGHEDGLATFWSCIVNLQTKEIDYSLGAPCRNEYKKYF